MAGSLVVGSLVVDIVAVDIHHIVVVAHTAADTVAAGHLNSNPNH